MAQQALAIPRGDATERAVRSLVGVAGNERCFDCDASVTADPWISANHGTTICFACAGTHRSLGVHISFVRSVNLDELKPKERAAMEFGGNSRLRAFLEAPEQARRSRHNRRSHHRHPRSRAHLAARESLATCGWLYRSSSDTTHQLPTCTAGGSPPR